MQDQYSVSVAIARTLFSMQFEAEVDILYITQTYRVIRDKLDETKQLFQTGNNPWGQKRDLCMFLRLGNLCFYL